MGVGIMNLSTVFRGTRQLSDRRGSLAIALIPAIISVLLAACASLSSGDSAKLTRDETLFELNQGDKALRTWQFHDAEAHYATARDLLRKVQFDSRQTSSKTNSVDASFNPGALEDRARFYETAARELYQAEDRIESNRERLLHAAEEAVSGLRARNEFFPARESLGRLALQAREAPSLYEVYFWNAQALLASYDVDDAYTSIVKSAEGAKRLASVGLPLRTPVLEILNLQAAILMRKNDWEGADGVYARKPIDDRYRDYEWRWMSEGERSIGRAEVALTRAKAAKDNQRPYLEAAAAHIEQGLNADPRNAKIWSLSAEVRFLLEERATACDAASQACTLGMCAQKESNKGKCSNVKVAK
jgi:hypothetical protein